MIRTMTILAGFAVLAAGAAVSTPVAAQEMIQRNCDFDNLGPGTMTTEERFMRIDRNSNGYVDRKEMVECLWPADFTGPDQHRWGEVVSLAEDTIATYDKDDDGRISRDEAVNAMSN